MPGNIIRSQTNIKYTITNSEWMCEWILPFDILKPVQRSFTLTNGIDPLDPSKNDYIIKLIPGLFTEVQDTIKRWIDAGDTNAKLLLLSENKPSFITFAEDTIGLKIIT
jgi:hypothetical protein